MDTYEEAKKHGIKQYLLDFFEEECLKFYPKFYIEEIQDDTCELYNLQYSGFVYDETAANYVKTNNFISYEYNGKKFDLFEYKDCFTYALFLCNEKTKKFRRIYLKDYKEFCEDGVYVYKDKYYCHYYEYYNSLLFFNRNQIIYEPGVIVASELRKPNSQDFASKYFGKLDKNEDNANGIIKGYVKENITEFYESDDDYILGYFTKIYRDIMLEMFKTEKSEIYNNTVKKEEEFVDNSDLREIDKNRQKTFRLYATKEFRDFCNSICKPELFYKELLKNGEVRKNLKNNFWIYHEFNSSLRNPENDFIEGEDFTFLIINAIKSLEYLLYRKIKNYEEQKMIKLYNNVSEKTMLDQLIYIIENHNEIFKRPDENMISKNSFDLYIKSYIELLYYVKNECRNGYFHKERIDDYETLCKNRKIVLEAIAKTICFLK